MTARTHMRQEGAHFTGVCLISSPQLTDDWSEVDCKLCLRIRDAEPVPEPEPEPFVPSGPYVPPKGCRTPLTVSRDQPRPPWLTEAHALRELVQAEDSGYRQKSVSDPSRFEPKGTGGSSSGGDVGQRQVERLAPVWQAREQAFEGPLVVCDTPRRELPRELCMLILVWRTVGDHVRRPPRASKQALQGEARDRVDYLHKQLVDTRVDFTAESVAIRVTGLVGFAVTAGVVDRVARAGRMAMRAYLRERDLLPRLMQREEREPMAIEQVPDLEGWSEIGDVIKRHADTARAYGSRPTNPLPHYVGPDNRVYAIRSEVLAWWREQFVARGQVG